jgi:hypothetical protein
MLQYYSFKAANTAKQQKCRELWQYTWRHRLKPGLDCDVRKFPIQLFYNPWYHLLWAKRRNIWLFCARNTNGKGPESQIRSTQERSYKIKLKAVFPLWKLYYAWPRHIFQACPVWIYTQSNITSILFTWVHYTNTANITKTVLFHFSFVFIGN